MGGLTTEVAFLSRALKMPASAKSPQTWPRQPAPRDGIPSSCWSRSSPKRSPPAKHTADRTASARPKPARQRPSTMFDFAHQRSVSRAQIAHLHQLDFVPKSPQRDLPGPTRNRQNASLHRPGSSSSPPRLPSRVRDRHPPGAPDSPKPRPEGTSPKSSNGSPESPSSSSMKSDVRHEALLDRAG